MHFGERLLWTIAIYVCTIIIYHFVNVILNYNNGIGLNILVFIIVKKEINIRQDFILTIC